MDPVAPVVVTEGAPAESPAAAALNHSAPADASATQEELNARIDESLGIVPAPKMETSSEQVPAEGVLPEGGDTAGDGKEVPASDSGVGKTGDGQGGEVPVPKPEEAPKPSDKGSEQTSAPSTALTLEVEDAEGKKYQISKSTDLPRDFTPKDNAQVIEILEGLADLKQRQAQMDTEAAKAEEQAKATASQQEQIASWDAEIAALQADGRIDKPKAAPNSPEFLNDPAVKRADQVFKFMEQENQRRVTTNTAPIRSFADALDKIELAEYRAAKVEAEKQELQTAKQKSGLIGRTSGGGGNEPPVYVAGSARDMYDL